MNKLDVTELIIERKRATGMTWAEIAKATGLSEVFTTSACLGMNSLPPENADKLVAALGLPQDAGPILSECPNKVFAQTIPTDPCIYRLYEITGVYGMAIKELIHEKCGDGIMSAIDFDLNVERVPDPKGDRIQITMSGKFLPYKQW